MTYLLDTWYVAAWQSEVKPGEMLARTLLDQPVVFFRDEQGKPHALLDRCPHRFAPLSMGKLCNGGQSVQCPYHGLRFDVNGRCVHNPHGNGTIPAAARVTAWPLVERHSALWIWMGDPAKADAGLIPDFSFMNDDTHHVAHSSMHVAAPYELESDNILDLSHIEFVHPIFSSPEVSSAPVTCAQDGNTVWSRRAISGEQLPPFLRQAAGLGEGELADRWLDVRWNAPACLALWSAIGRHGQPREQASELAGVHLFTPETESSTHYFFGNGVPRSLGHIGKQISEHALAAGAALDGPFHGEDKPMIEAQFKRMQGRRFEDMKPVMLSSDAAAVRARRVLSQLIAAERVTRQAAEIKPTRSGAQQP